ncbi:hypothetical protein B0H16DRAFT_1734873 [Mycena metata]|uniref:Uncharacterized protein n=1 Tax=Mycena metata TaxID=1033252 RepID=A0AAD7MR17_9AGAR|nr:hypothetical protein B0H16DRAFT_1734873 [Mycena metata]
MVLALGTIDLHFWWPLRWTSRSTQGVAGGGDGNPAEGYAAGFGMFAMRALAEGEEIVAGVNGAALPNAPMTAQRHVIAQLANILHTLSSSEYACTSALSSIFNPAVPAPPSLPPPSV